MTTARKDSVINSMIVLLVLLAILSMILLFTQIGRFSKAQVDRVISLTETREPEEEAAQVSAGRASAPASVRKAGPVRPVQGVRAAAGKRAPGGSGEQTQFAVEDGELRWTTHTDIEIFHVRYDNNGDLVFTVESGNSDSVIAPGTENSYTYRVLNEESETLEYTMIVEAYVAGTDLWIPVEARLYRQGGEYLAGSADGWTDVLDLDGITVTTALAAGGYHDYVLDWRWPFERTDGEGLEANDAYDTMLGNLAVDEDLTLHIVIRTLAQIADPDTPVPPGPKTGDPARPVLYAGIMGASLCLIVVLLLTRKKKRDETGER